MKKLLLGMLVTMSSLSAMAALEPGELAPDFTLNSALDGEISPFSLKSTLVDGPVVVYFYPSAYTAGCNVQAHEFSVHHDEFAAAGAKVVGVSLDSIDRLKSFSADPEYCAGKLPVASDEGGEVAKAFGLEVTGPVEGAKDTRGEAIQHGFTERTTFIVSPEGTIAEVIEGVSPRKNVEQALSAVQNLPKLITP